ncbi:MAG: iron-containing redox enzyme family protein [Actinomycetota bacterium]
MDRLPAPRGPITEALLDAFVSGDEAPSCVPPVEPSVTDDDLHLALYLCYELHYRGLPGVDDRREWDPGLLAFRARLEQVWEAALREEVGPVGAIGPPQEMSRALIRLAAEDRPPSLSRYLARSAGLAEFREFVIHRSLYTLKEADPHSFAIARIEGNAKSALMEIQADEYGGGKADRMHSAIFARTMRALGLDDAYGAYLDLVPGVTLATVNLVSLFGLHRRLRGAAMGHLALFELTSAIPNRRYGNGLRRLGLGPEVTDYYDEHVEADSVHDMIAAYDLVGSLVADDPSIGAEVLFGARALASLEERFARHLLDAWGFGRSSLRERALSATS